MRWHDGLKTEVTSCVFEYSWTNLMGILNFFKDVVIGYRLFWISMKLSHKVTSWVSWMFESWRHGYCEYSWSDLMGILNIYEVTLLVFWILMKWRYGDIQKLRHGCFEIHIQNYKTSFEYSKYDITSRIIKILICHYEYSKYSCHIQNYTFEYWKYKNIPKYPWRHFMNIQNASWVIWIFESWRHGYFENSWSNVIGLLNTHEVTSWLFMKWPHG